MKQIYVAKFYCNPYSILIIDKHKKLRRLFCPFKVMALSENPLGKIVYVSSVKMRGLYGLTYVIKDKEYDSRLFRIII